MLQILTPVYVLFFLLPSFYQKLEIICQMIEDEREVKRQTELEIEK